MIGIVAVRPKVILGREYLYSQARGLVAPLQCVEGELPIYIR
jgi:hypothetical protein